MPKPIFASRIQAAVVTVTLTLAAPLAHGAEVVSAGRAVIR